MTAGEFVLYVNSLVPSRDALIASGAPEEIIDELLSGLSLVPRADPWALDYDDETISLICQWDVEGFDLGSFEFASTVRRNANGIIVGYLEAEMLVFRPGAGDYVVVEHENGKVSCEAAPNGNVLLDVIALRYRSFVEGIFVSREQKAQMRENAERQGMMAVADSKYSQFCRMLFL